MNGRLFKFYILKFFIRFCFNLIKWLNILQRFQTLQFKDICSWTSFLNNTAIRKELGFKVFFPFTHLFRYDLYWYYSFFHIFNVHTVWVLKNQKNVYLCQASMNFFHIHIQFNIFARFKGFLNKNLAHNYADKIRIKYWFKITFFTFMDANCYDKAYQ